MSRTVIAYVDRRPIYRDDGPSHARLAGHGGLPMSMALTSITTVTRPAPVKVAFVRDRPLCARWMPRVGTTCARNPGHRSECRSASLLERHRLAGL